MNIFTFLTPITYWILIVLWLYIFTFYIKKLRTKFLKGQLISVLIIILAIDAFRTLFESLYFGAWYTALAGFIPKYIHTFLIRPEMVFIPKIINVIAAVIVIILLIYKWLPKEESEKTKLNDLIKKRTEELSRSNVNYQAEIKEHKHTAKNLMTRTTELSDAVSLLEQEISDRKKVEEALQGSEGKYRSMLESMKEAIYICSPDYRVEYMNSAMIKRIGHNASGAQCHKVMHGLDEKCSWCVFEKVKKAEFIDYELVSPKDDRTYYISNSPISNTDGSISKLTVFRDVTEFKKLETNLQQSQKMESIGVLAGGIAHDFNNILFPIIGHSEMLMEDVPEDSPLQESLNEINVGALRAKDLVQQILTFSRQDNSELNLMKIQPIIKEALKLIRATIPTTIEIIQDIHPSCRPIKADPSKIHQIVMNLATNSFHAMEEFGGELNISVKEIVFNKYNLINPEMIPGEYVCLSISDTGVGMDKKLTEKIFDPFFTTKEKGKGTGMGLSVVHGVVKGMNGSIQVHSSPDTGSEFKVYLPIEKSSVDKQSTQTNETVQGGTERILVVDDEIVVVKMTQQILERMGYQVSSRSSSIEALEAFTANPTKYDLVITDLEMPNMAGDKLSAELIKIRPDIPIILCTGFSRRLTEEKALSIGIKGFLQKPIIKLQMAKMIRKMLDKAKNS